jgi:hypothetical protein
VVVHPVREAVGKHADAEEALVEAVNTATNRTARRRESHGAAAVGDVASFVSNFFLSIFFFWQQNTNVGTNFNKKTYATLFTSVISMPRTIMKERRLFLCVSN